MTSTTGKIELHSLNDDVFLNDDVVSASGEIEIDAERDIVMLVGERGEVAVLAFGLRAQQAVAILEEQDTIV